MRPRMILPCRAMHPAHRWLIESVLFAAVIVPKRNEVALMTVADSKNK